MMRKQIKPNVQICSNPAAIKILIDDEYILKCVELPKFKLPHSLTDLYKADAHSKAIMLTPKYDRVSPDEEHVARVKAVFEGIVVHHVRGRDIEEKEEDFKKKICNLIGHDILGVKKFYVDTGRFQKDDYLIYKRGETPIRQVLKQLKNYLTQESLLLELDSLFEQRMIPAYHCRSVCIALVQEVYPFIMAQVQKCSLKADKIVARYDEKTREKKPIYSIQLVISGSAMSVHELFLAIEQKVHSIATTVVEIDEERIPTQNSDNLQQLFPDTKITKISSNTVLILDRYLDFAGIQNIKRKLKQIVWRIDQDSLFSLEQIRTLQAEIKNNSLTRHMRQRKVEWEHIDYNKSTFIQLTCDKQMKNRFVEECRNYLKSFVKVQQICVNFDTNYLIQIFKKYYQQKFQSQFTVTFEIGDGYMIRSNFNKYSQEIQQQLKVVREKIRKKTMSIISRRSITEIARDNIKLFSEVANPPGYEHNLLGCHVYNMGNIRIKMRPIESLKRQEEILAYIFDDGIMESSILYKIIRDNKTNLNSFLSDAHRTKKPDRLRQYITETCPYAYRTVLLHSGPERVTNTLKRDLETLFAILDHKSTIVILEHENDFLREVFSALLQFMKNQKPALISNESNSSVSRISKNKFEANFYFQGKQRALSKIEQVMKSLQLGIQKCTEFYLEEFDLQKIFSLRYFQMIAKIDQNKFEVSPIIAEILDFQLNRETKRKNMVNCQKKKFVFSLPKSQQNNQLVQFIVNTKCRTCFKVTHDEGLAQLFCERPHVQNLQWEELDSIPELMQTILTIHKYCQRCMFIIISASCTSDELHYSRTIKLSNDYYMVKEGQNDLLPIVLDVKNETIFEDQTKSKGKFVNKSTNLIDYFEIFGYKDEFDKIFV